MKNSFIKKVLLLLVVSSLRLFGASELQEGFASQGFFLNLLMGFGAVTVELTQENNASYIVAQIVLDEEYARNLGKDTTTLDSWHVDVYTKESELIAVAYNEKIAATLFYDMKRQRGFLDFADVWANFSIQENQFIVDATIKSLKETLNLMGIDIQGLDASIMLHAMKDLDEQSPIEGEITIPHYLYKTANELYEESNNSVQFSFFEDQLQIHKYDIGFQGARYYSDKESLLRVDAESNILIESFWIYDNLLLHGMYASQTKDLNLTLKSDKFHFEQYDSNLTLRADLSVSIDSQANQLIKGELELLEGYIGYMPKEQFAIDDEDIIIIQEQKKEDENLQRKINLSLSSAQSITYKFQENEILFTPKLSLRQNNQERVSLNGTIEIFESDLRFYDKDFRLLKSEVLFDGKADNPSLFLTLNHTTEDDVNIEIFITKRVENPLILFSSSPSMSQNDILSYLLFGQSSAGAFDMQDEGANSQSVIAPFLLATSLKKVLNDTTPLQIDKLNILTNETTGRYGYEVGAKLGRDLRVVYKNNEIATVIFQYRLSNSLRFDVDLKESGQGASIIYMKDFDLHMPWHVENNESK